MNNTLKAVGSIGAELGAVKAENEKLRKALKRIIDRCEAFVDDEAEMRTPSVEVLMGIAEDAIYTVHLADAALSLQAEPVEPAPVQDGREAFEARMRLGGYSNPEKHPDGSYVSSAMELWWQGWNAYAAWQRTRTAQTEQQPEQSEDNRRTLQWAVDRWHAEVANRPLVNVHRRTLDGTWRQIIRHLGEDDVVLLGPRHDDMLDASGNPLPQYVAQRGDA